MEVNDEMVSEPWVETPAHLCIEWIDASNSGWWHTEEEALKHATDHISSVGWLVREDDEMLVLARDACKAKSPSHSRFGAVLAIPKSAIQKREVIKEE